jgi:dTDP-4-dehydrorhamnose 3,5-epimerase
MDIKVSSTEIEGVLLIEPEWFEDARGFFMESYHQQRFAEHGLHYAFVQDNHSRSRRGVLRGFHYQDLAAPQVRLVRCTVGEVWDVVVDLRVGSPTFGRWAAFTLSAENRHQVVIPPEFAHGFVVLSDVAEIQYKCTNFHTPSAERALAWDDGDVAVAWPVSDPVLSARDRQNPTLRDYLQHPHFTYQARALAGAGERHA